MRLTDQHKIIITCQICLTVLLLSQYFLVIMYDSTFYFVKPIFSFSDFNLNFSQVNFMVGLNKFKLK